VTLNTRLTLFKLKLLNNLEAWKREGEITDIEIKRFKENAYNLWDTEFRLQYGSFSEEEYNNKGKEVLRSVLKHSFNLSGQELDVDMQWEVLFTFGRANNRLEEIGKKHNI
jgi:hypothetical protein